MALHWSKGIHRTLSKEEESLIHIRIRTADEVVAQLPQVFPCFDWGRMADSFVLVGGFMANIAFTIKGFIDCPPRSKSTCMRTWCNQEAQRGLAYGELLYFGCGLGVMALRGFGNRRHPAGADQRWRTAADVGCDFVSLANYTSISLVPRIKTGCTSASKQKGLEQSHMKKGGTVLEYTMMAFRTFAFSVTDICVGFIGLAGLQVKFNSMNFWPNSFWCFGLYGAFLNQLMGMVNVERLKIQMVYRVLFAGEDSSFSRAQEESMMNFQAVLLRGLCDLHGNVVGTFLYLTHTSEDLQALVVDDSQHKGGALALSGDAVASRGASWWYMGCRTDMFLSQAIQFVVRR